MAIVMELERRIKVFRAAKGTLRFSPGCGQ